MLIIPTITALTFDLSSKKKLLLNNLLLTIFNGSSVNINQFKLLSRTLYSQEHPLAFFVH